MNVFLHCRIFQEHGNWSISIVEVRENAEKDYHTDVDIFIIPNSTHHLLTSEEIMSALIKKPLLLAELHKYGYVDKVGCKPMYSMVSASRGGDPVVSDNKIV